MMKKRLTDVAMVCLIGPTHPRLSLPCLKWDQSSIQQQKMGSEFVLSPGEEKKVQGKMTKVCASLRIDCPFQQLKSFYEAFLEI